MYGITDLRKGVLIELDGGVYKVISYEHSAKGRGAGIVKTKLKNIMDDTTVARTFQGSDQITPAEVTDVSAQFLYADGDQAHFMRLDDYEQVSLPREEISNKLDYLIEGSEVDLLYIDEVPRGIELPIKIEMEVTSADPNVKGNSANNVMKNCRTESGLNVQVPMFIESGDRIVVDTRDGSYVERA